MNNIDFIIPTHLKDLPTLNLTIKSIKRQSCCKNIYLISKNDPYIENTIWISEHQYYKFVSLEMIQRIAIKKGISNFNRSGWLYQQFLKLLSSKVINNLSDNFVIVDSDTIFLKDINFNSKYFYYCKVKEYHTPYLKPISSLLNIKNTIGFSTICHHAIFFKSTLEQMINEIEIRFNTNIVEAILDTLDFNEQSCFSEWDLYANYMILNHSNITKERSLKFTDINFIPNALHIKLYSLYFDFISSHAYKRIN
jgi:hypothetical protein